MKSAVMAAVVLVLAAPLVQAANPLTAPLRLTPELEPYVVEAPDGRLFAHIDDMFLPVSAGAKSGSYGTTWTGGVVYYTFAANVGASDGRPMSGDGDGRRAAWRAAATEWEATVPGLSFVEGAGSGNYIVVESAAGNSSYVGMVGGAQTMYIFNWDYRFIIAHEIGHALGLIHEQSRTDRATYVTVNWVNIENDKEFNFDIWGGTSDHGSYDFDSVMHYGRCDFAVGGWNCSPNFTMDATVAGAAAVGMTQSEANAAMGQRNDLSAGDIAGVRDLYPGPADLVFSATFDNGRSNAWSSVFGESFTCAHDLCQVGSVLDAECDPCVNQICDYDHYCCEVEWDSICVGYVITVCGQSCD